MTKGPGDWCSWDGRHRRRQAFAIAYSSQGGENRACFACFAEFLAGCGQTFGSLPELLAKDREFQCTASIRMWPLRMSQGEPIRLDCECEACGGHGEPLPAAEGLEACGMRLVCRACVATGHDTPIRIPAEPNR